METKIILGILILAFFIWIMILAFSKKQSTTSITKRHPYFLKDDIDYTYKPKCKCNAEGKKKNYTYPAFVREHYKPELKTDGQRKEETTDKN
tara:strand:+ start:79 stop:354 length:276 start_codon:yes stop_codon:yes gene_type:complete